jgi:hypothetical protein
VHLNVSPKKKKKKKEGKEKKEKKTTPYPSMDKKKPLTTDVAMDMY